MQRPLVFSEGEFYHIYNRGVDKRIIFLDEHDCRRFVRLLYAANSTRSLVFRTIEHKAFADIDRDKPLVAIGAYVLMPNHFHILIKEIALGGISAFMEKLLTAYSSYFNKRHGRSGRLFQNTFQARHVDNDDYLKYLFAYIHLNPLSAKHPHWKTSDSRDLHALQEYIEKYLHSSFLDYTGTHREENLILAREAFPEYFSSPHSFRDFTRDWIAVRASFSDA